jgi:hypothetical protein
MSNTRGFARLAQVAALSVALAAPLGSVAFAQANDTPQAWGAGQDIYNRYDSPHAPITFPPNTRVATNSKTAPVTQPDLAGSGGHMDQVYREIYAPGSITPN